MPILENARHELFAQSLAKGKTADDAYALAGYKPNRGNASSLKANQNIDARVREILTNGANRAEISVATVLREFGRIGFADIRKAFDENGNLLAPADWDDEFAASVSSIEVVTRSLPGEADDELDAQPHGGALARKRNARVEYVHKIKTWDKNSSLDKIGKHLGMFIERIGGPTGEALETTVHHRLDPSSAKLIADLIK